MVSRATMQMCPLLRDIYAHNIIRTGQETAGDKSVVTDESVPAPATWQPRRSMSSLDVAADHDTEKVVMTCPH